MKPALSGGHGLRSRAMVLVMVLVLVLMLVMVLVLVLVLAMVLVLLPSLMAPVVPVLLPSPTVLAVLAVPAVPAVARAAAAALLGSSHGFLFFSLLVERQNSSPAARALSARAATRPWYL